MFVGPEGTVALLAKAGYAVTALTGRAETQEYLTSLGAAELIDRAHLQGAVRPLPRETWVGAVDSVSSATLANILAQMEYGAAVAACGLAGGMDLPGTVLPHILRSVTLIDVDSVLAPIEKRQVAWQRLARDLPLGKLTTMTTVVPMSDIVQWAEAILAGKVRGRVVVDVTK